MRITVKNEFSTRCLGFLTNRECDVHINQLGPSDGAPGGFHLRIDARYTPPHSHSFYFSQEDRIQIGLFLLAGVSLPEMTLKFDPKRHSVRLSGVVAPGSSR